MNRTVDLAVAEVEYMPALKAPGILYVSERFKLAIHLCPCGCGLEAVTPIGKDDWTLTVTEGRATMSPSLLMRTPCASHYYVKDGKIAWV